MTNPDLPVEAVEATARALYARDGYAPWEHEELDVLLTYRAQARLLLAAALPHLRVQETPGGVEYEDADLETEDDVERRDSWYRLAVERGEGDEFIAMLAHERRLPATRAERSATPHPRPVVDREAVINAIASQLPEEVWDDQVAADAADTVLALLPTEEAAGEPSLIDLVRELRETLGMPSVALPTSPQRAWEEAIARVADLSAGVCGACVRGDSEVKTLVATATRLGYELGRKETLDLFLEGMSLGEDWQIEDPRITYVDVQIDKDLYQTLQAVRNATSEPRTHPDGHSDLPKAAKRPQEPCEGGRP